MSSDEKLKRFEPESDYYDTIVTYSEVEAGKPSIVIGNDGHHDYYSMSPKTARELAAYLIKLADEIEGEQA